MSKRRKPPPGTSAPREREIPIVVPYRLPVHYSFQVEAHEQWLEILTNAEGVLMEDVELQRKVAKGLRIKDRNMPPEVLGRLYAQYCELINRMYDTYLVSLQMQRLPYIQEIVGVILKRMFELRNELVHLIVNDYIYVDTSIKQLIKTPFDIQIVVPYHYARDLRPGSTEQLLQKMWQDAINRKIRAARPKKVKVKEVTRSAVFGSEPDLGEIIQKSVAQVASEQQAEVVEEEIEEEEIEEEEESIDEDLPTESYLRCCLIQRMERYRKFYKYDFVEKCNYRRRYFARTDVVPATPEMMIKAADLIYKFYRRFMAAKREHLRQYQMDVKLGLLWDYDKRPLQYKEEREKLYEKRRQKKMKIDAEYQKQIEKERTRLLLWGRDAELIEDITAEVTEWFKEWYVDYEYFPLYPYELEGGTIIVAKGDYPTIEEQKEDDEKYMKATRGKTKEQIQDDKKQAKMEEIQRKEIEKDKEKKEQEAIFKARCNPRADMGYKVIASKVTDKITEAIRRYRMAWSIYDRWPPETNGDIIYGFMKPVVTEDLMEKLQLDCRKIVDELMRLELKTFNKAQKMMFARVDKKWPKRRGRKRPRPVKPLKPFTYNDNTLKKIQQIFDLEIISKPTLRMDDIVGDLNFRAYEANIADPWAKYPSPAYGDVKRRLILSCVFGSGIEPDVPRKKAVLLMGLPRNGKSFLADCVAGEMGAVKFDISPEVFSSKAKRIGKMLGLVFTAARIFQPSVIFCKNVDRAFYKTVPPEERRLKAATMKSPLTKLIKGMSATDKVIFIGTCTNPLLTKQRPMFKLFSEVIIVPKPDYGSLQRYLYDSFQKIRSMPRDFNVAALAVCFQGIGFGQIMEVFSRVITNERICRLIAKPFEPLEFIEYMIENNIQPMSDTDYQKMVDLWLKYSPLKKEREEYQLINTKRAYAYAKLAQVQAEKEAKAAAAAAAAKEKK